jgi:hypothetical protein
VVTISLGGVFAAIGGQPRARIAALDTVSGAATAWNPGASDAVNSLVVCRGVVYAAGHFTTIGGQPRAYLAAIDAAGLATPWNPSPDSYVEALAVSGRTLYAGGRFTSIGGKQRVRIAALDAEIGVATAWNPGANSLVRSLAVADGVVYAGGQFTIIGGRPRNRLAALESLSGEAIGWYADAGGVSVPVILALAVGGGAVYAGGCFNTIGAEPRAGLASLTSTVNVDVPGVPDVPALSLAPTIPSPARGRALIRFTLPAASPVTLAIYDVAGRRVALPLDHAFEPAGTSQVELDTTRMPAGRYCYRLTAGAASATRAMVVLK